MADSADTWRQFALLHTKSELRTRLNGYGRGDPQSIQIRARPLPTPSPCKQCARMSAKFKVHLFSGFFSPRSTAQKAICRGLRQILKIGITARWIASRGGT